MALKKTEETTRTHFSFRIDVWATNGESIVEHVAGVEDYQAPPANVGPAPLSPCDRARV
jgi:hypothetical protein